MEFRWQISISLFLIQWLSVYWAQCKDGEIGICNKSTLMEISADYSIECDFFFTIYTMQNLAMYFWCEIIKHSRGHMFHVIAFFLQKQIMILRSSQVFYFPNVKLFLYS